MLGWIIWITYFAQGADFRVGLLWKFSKYTYICNTCHRNSTVPVLVVLCGLTLVQVGIRCVKVSHDHVA